jgi:hypothetical protein
VRPPSQEFASTTADRTVQHAPVGANVDAIVSGFEAMFARARSEGDPPPADLQSTLKNFGGQKPIEAPAFARWIGRGLEWFEEWIKRNEGLKHAFVEVIHEASEFRRHLPR